MTERAGRRAFFEESMKSISVNSYAKINLSLDVQGLTKDGYHQVSMITDPPCEAPSEPTGSSSGRPARPYRPRAA